MTSTSGPVVWIVNHYSTIPSKDGAGNRHFRLSQELSSQGWRPVLFLASTRHPSGDQHLKGASRRHVGIDGGVPYVMVKSPPYKGGIPRLLNMATFAGRLLSPRMTSGVAAPDIVVGSTVHLLAAWSALRLARRHRVPFVFEVRDIWPETLIDLGALSPTNPVAKALSRFSRYLCANADLVVSPLPGVRAYLDDLGLSHVPFEWVSNGVDLPDHAQDIETVSEDGNFTLMYLGSHGNANGLMGLLDAFDIAAAEPGAGDMRLRLVGDGTQKAAMIAYAAGLRAAQKIEFEGRIPKHDVIARAREAHALVVNIEDLPVYRFGISLNKLFDYMASERPTIIATSAVNNPVLDAGAGITVSAGDVRALACAMRTMRDYTSESRAEMGRRGAAHVRKEYTFSVLAARMGKALERVRTTASSAGKASGGGVKKALRDDSVIHVSSAHPITDNRIHYRECVTLERSGYNVSLVARESVFEEDSSRVRLIRLPKRGRLQRMLFSTAQAMWIAWRSKSKIVHLHDPELIPFIPLLRLGRRVVVYDAHEDLPVQVLDKPYTNRWTRGPLVIFTRALIAVARQAHLVVAATETIASRFPEDKTVLVRNFPPLRDEEDVPPDMSQRKDIAIYIGALSGTRGTFELLRAIEDPAFPHGWSVHLAGPMADDVAEAVHDATLSGRVVYHGQLPPLAARDLLLNAKVGIVTLRNTSAYRDALPTKLFEYFAAGLPAVASDFPLWRSIIESAGGGTLVDETDPSAIAQAIAGYAESPEEWAMHSSNASRAAQDTLNWAHEGQKLVEAYRRLSRGTDAS